MKRVLILNSVFLLTACATVPSHTTTATFDPAEVAWAEAEGANTITGNAVLRTVSGEVRTCAGFDVSLVPVSRYAVERFTAIYGSPEGGYSNRAIEFTSTDPGYMSARRTTTCDSQGNFRFERLPDGEYYVTTRVTWGIPMGYGMTSTQGGVLSQKLSLRGGETRQIVLTAK